MPPSVLPPNEKHRGVMTASGGYSFG